MNNKHSSLQDLQRQFDQFRDCWPDRWPGLAAIVSGCLASLGHRDGDVLEERIAAIRDCMMAAAEAVERDGFERGGQGTEPAYHNRLHIADTLASMACLLLNSRQAPAERPTDTEWLLLLCMLAHDYRHTGRVNRVPAELEQASVDGLRPLMQAAGMAEEDQALVAELILMTDPTRVGNTHQAIRGRAFDLAEFEAKAVLLQESDILASVLPVVGIEQTRRLATEWSAFSESMASGLLKTGGRITFLRDYACFSSPASRRLGIPELISQQLAVLSARDASLPL